MKRLNDIQEKKIYKYYILKFYIEGSIVFFIKKLISH